jgi:hypothetical protein
VKGTIKKPNDEVNNVRIACLDMIDQLLSCQKSTNQTLNSSGGRSDDLVA